MLIMVAAVSAVSGENELPPPDRQKRLNSFMQASHSDADAEQEERYAGFGKCKFKYPQFLHHLPNPVGPIDSQSKSPPHLVIAKEMWNLIIWSVPGRSDSGS